MCAGVECRCLYSHISIHKYLSIHIRTYDKLAYERKYDYIRVCCDSDGEKTYRDGGESTGFIYFANVLRIHDFGFWKCSTIQNKPESCE